MTNGSTVTSRSDCPSSTRRSQGRTVVIAFSIAAVAALLSACSSMAYPTLGQLQALPDQLLTPVQQQAVANDLASDGDAARKQADRMPQITVNQ